MKDALTVNGNIVAAVEKTVGDRKAVVRSNPNPDPDALDSVPTVYHSNCAGHSAVLCCKPVIKFQISLSTFVVRAGHLNQSQRWFNTFLEDLLTYFDKHWNYRQVEVLPMECARWQEENRKLLEFTSMAGDLTETQKEDALYFDQSKLKGEQATHWCLPDCRCGRSKPKARRLCLNSAVALSGRSIDLALEYRWKHIETGTATLLRARGYHDFFKGAIELRCKDPRKLREAEEELAAAAERDSLALAEAGAIRSG